MKETVKINLNVLTQQVEEGMKKDALAKHYGISVVQMGKALKDAGLKIRKFHAPAFELVTEEETNAPDVKAEDVVDANPVANTEETPVGEFDNSQVADATPTQETEEDDSVNNVTWDN